MIGGINIVKMAIFPKTQPDLQIQCDLYQNPSDFGRN